MLTYQAMREGRLSAGRQLQCPKCGGEIVQKRSKKGTTFYGCANYPECDFVSWDMPIEEKCPTCGSYMVLKRGRGKAVYKKCGNEQCPTNQKGKKEEENA